jgi:hypothetical protein
MKKITVKFGNLKCAGCGREVKVGENAVSIPSRRVGDVTTSH